MSPPLLQCAGEPGRELHLGQRPALALPLLGHSWRFLQVFDLGASGPLTSCILALLSVSLSLFFHLVIPVDHFLSVCLSAISLSLSPHISLSVSLSLTISLYFFLSQYFSPFFLSSYFSVSICLYLNLSLHLSLSLSLSVTLSVSLALSLSLSVTNIYLFVAVVVS